MVLGEEEKGRKPTKSSFQVSHFVCCEIEVSRGETMDSPRVLSIQRCCISFLFLPQLAFLVFALVSLCQFSRSWLCRKQGLLPFSLSFICFLILCSCLQCSVFALQLFGFDVDPINTVQYSNHTGVTLRCQVPYRMIFLRCFLDARLQILDRREAHG